MKIIDENPVEGTMGVNTPPQPPTPPRTTPPAPPKSYTRAGNVYIGVVVILLGLLWLGLNYDIISGLAQRIICSVWMLLIAVGGYLLTIRRTTGGVIVAVIGLVMLVVDTLDCYVSLDRIILPILLVIVGILVLVTQLCKKRK